MPAGLLIGLLGWFASHLIVITLLGFVVVGFWVFGVIAPDAVSPRQTSRAPHSGVESSLMPDAVSAADPKGSRPSEKSPAQSPDPAGNRQAPQAAAAGATVDARQDSPVDDAQKARRQPKMIGGSLPIYDVRPRRGDAPPGRTADGFRPPTELPQVGAMPPTREERVQSARRAFWNGDFEAAEAAYMDLIADDPDDPDAFGELGNLYESMGRPALAAEAFFEAGTRLKRRGEIDKLQHVIDFLNEKGDTRAGQLEGGTR